MTHPNQLMQLRQAACVSGDDSAHRPALALSSTNATLLAQKIRDENGDYSIIDRQHGIDRARLGAPPSFDDAGPSAKIRLIARGGAASATPCAFFATGVSLNIIRQAQFPLRSVASGLSCWIAFCDL